MWCIMACDHMTITADHDDKVRDVYQNEHYARDIDPCDDFEYYTYSDDEILEALGRDELLFDDGDWIAPELVNDGDNL